MPYCFSRSFVPFQGHKGKTSSILFQIGRFRTVTQFEFTHGLETMHKVWRSIEEVSYCFPRSFIKFRGHRGQKLLILTRNEHFRTVTPVEFTHGFEMMHTAWRSIEEMSYCFPMSSIKFQSHTGQKSANCDPNWAFLDCNSSLNITDGFDMMHRVWRSIEEVSYCFSRPSIKFQGNTGWKIDELNPIWVRLLGGSQLSDPSDLPCSSKTRSK